MNEEEINVAESALDIGLNVGYWNENEEKILNELIAKLYAIRMHKN